MNLPRRKTKKIKVGNLYIGGNSPISIQSMTNTNTSDITKTVKQIRKLIQAGCEIVRVAVPNLKSAKSLGKIKSQINIPLVADIHFSHQLALEAIKQGVDKLRLNPGNIGNEQKIKQVVLEARKKNIPIRIGVNAGSLEKDILKKHNNRATAQAMADSALKHIKILEKLKFKNIIVSLKASDIHRTVESYKLLSTKINYPFHIGITEAGTLFRGTIMSAVGLGHLLYEGLGDTLRVSLTANPVEEIKVAKEILYSLKLRPQKVTVTSCPTCGRTEINLIKLAEKVEKELKNHQRPVHVAVMGCVVNGPGEAREADWAIIGGKKIGLICQKGKIIKKVPEKKLLKEFLTIIKKNLKTYENNC